MSEKRNIWLWVPALVWMSVIFYASAIPAAYYHENVTGAEWPGQVAHIVEYAILSALYLIALRGTSQLNKLHLPLVSTVLATLYGISDEIHQSFVPGREVSAFDIYSNLMGAIAGAILVMLVVSVLSTREPAT